MGDQLVADPADGLPPLEHKPQVGPPPEGPTAPAVPSQQELRRQKRFLMQQIGNMNLDVKLHLAQLIKNGGGDAFMRDHAVPTVKEVIVDLDGLGEKLPAAVAMVYSHVSARMRQLHAPARADSS